MTRKPLARAVRGTIQGYKGGDSQRKSVESPDSLHSIANARIIDLIGEGELEGFVHGPENFLQDVYFDETPVENADGSQNFKNFTVDFRAGTQTQDYIPGFPAVENEIGIGVELISSSPWTRAVSDKQLSAVNIRLSTSALSQADQDTGDVHGYLVEYAIDVSTDGGAFVEMMRSAFNGKTTSTYERSHRINLRTATDTGWVVRVRRLTPNSDSVYIQDTTFVVSITEIIDGKFRYPNSALVGVQIDASQFQSIPVRAYHLKGRRLKVPSNYDPVTRAYTGVWDGTFKTAYSNNPAWVFYDLATHPRFGLGNLVSELVIDKWSLYAIAQYCDEPVPDDNGGMEPRMVCNIYLQKPADAYKVLGDLAAVFRGICYWASGSIVPVADRPSDPVYTYTNANVVDGMFVYESSGRRARHTAVTVSYNDNTDFGRLKTDYYDDPAAIDRFGYQLTDIVAIGSTSRSQARRVAKWLLLSEKLLTNAVTFSVGMDGTFSLPGQIIRVADQHRAGRRMGGRISGATLNSVTLDVAPETGPSINDIITVHLSDGKAQSRTISAVEGRVVLVSVPFTEAPAVESVWAIDSTDLNTQLFRVLSVKDNGEDGTYTMYCLQHNPSLFDAVDLGSPVEIPPISVATPQAFQERVADVTITMIERASQTIVLPLLSATWTPAPGATRYEVQWQKDNGNWTAPEIVASGVSSEYPNPFPGIYMTRVVAINALNIRSLPTYSDPYTMIDPTKTPGMIDDINDTVDDIIDDLSQEIEDRTNQDLEIAENLAQEVLDRIAGDTALAADIAANADAIASENADRATQYAALAAADAAEAADRAAADAAAVAALADEATARNAAIAAAVDASAASLMAEIGSIQSQLGDILGAPEWDNVTAYDADDLVQYDGKLYRALSAVPAGALLTNTLYWELIGNYSTLGEAVAAIGTQTSANAGDISALASTVTSYGTRLDTAESTLTSLASSMVDADTALANDITALESTVNNPSTGVAATATALNALTTRVDNNEDSITSHSESITSIESKIGNWGDVDFTQSIVPTAGGVGDIWIDTGEQNKLEWSEDLSQTSWTKTGVVATPGAYTSGGVVFSRVVPNAGSAAHYISESGNSGTLKRYRMRVKYDGIRYLVISWSASAGYGVCFDLVSGTVAVNPTSGPLETRTPSITSLADGVFELTYVSGSGTVIFIKPSLTAVGTYNDSWTADGTAGVLIGGASCVDYDFDSRYVKTTGIGIDTRGQTVAKKWDGTNWVLAPVGTLATAIQNLDTRTTQNSTGISSVSSAVTSLQSLVGAEILGAELVANGNLAAGNAGFTYSTGGAPIPLDDYGLLLNKTSSSQQVKFNVNLVAGKTYRLSFDWRRNSGTAPGGVRIGDYYMGSLVPGHISLLVTGAGTYSTASIGSSTSSTTFNGSFKNISIREVITVGGLADAVSSLTTTVTKNGADIISNSAAITTLQSTVNNPTTGVAATATALAALTTTVTSQGGTITSQGASITSLQSKVGTSVLGPELAPNGDFNVSPIGAAWTTGGITSTVAGGEVHFVSDGLANRHADLTLSGLTIGATYRTVIRAKQGSVVGDPRIRNWVGMVATSTPIQPGGYADYTFDLVCAASTVIIRVYATGNTTVTGADFWLDKVSVRMVTNTSIADAVNGLTTTVIQNGNDITSVSNSVTSLQTTVNNPTTGVAANATAISSLTARVTATENSITSISSNVTSLQNSLTSLNGTVAGNSSAIGVLQTRTTATEAGITTNAGAITSLNSRLTTAEGNIAGAATAISGLNTTVTQHGDDITAISSDVIALQTAVGDLTTGAGTTAGAISALDSRVSDTETGLAAAASDITSLELALADINSDVTANATAISTLDTRLTSAEGTVASQSSAITTLQNTVNNPTTGVSATAAAVTTLTTRVTTAEGTISSLSASITSINSTLANKADASALSALTTRVTTAEGNISSLSTSLTSLTSTVAGKATTTALDALTTRVTDAEGDIDAINSSITSLTTTVNGKASTTALNALTTRVTTAEGTISSLSSAITTLQSDLDAAEGVGAANSAAITVLQTNVASKNKVFYQSAAPTSGMIANDLWIESDNNNKLWRYSGSAWIDVADTDKITVFAQASAPSTTGRKTGDLWIETDANNKLWRWSGSAWVDSSDPRITANASAITSLQSTVNNPTTGVAATASAVASLSTRVDVTEDGIETLSAAYQVTLDVNGYLSGFTSINNGTTSIFKIKTDKFQLDPSSPTGARTEFSGGNWRVYDSAGVLRVRMGVW